MINPPITTGYVDIEEVDIQKVSINGIHYYKNFLSIVHGNNITIYNAYDSKNVICQNIPYTNIQVDGSYYANVGLTQIALLPILYTRDTLGYTTGIGVPDATASVKGKLKLTGDLGGTANFPLVPDLAFKESFVNKTNDIAANATSTVKYPTSKAVADYVQANVGANVTLTEDANGDDFNIDSSNSPDFIINLPIAGPSKTGKLTFNDWNLFNSKLGKLHSTTTPSAILTGTTIQVILSHFLISGGTIADEETIDFEFKASKLNAISGATNWRVYINTSATLTGATQIAYYQLGAGAHAQHFAFRRRFHRRGSNLLHFVGTLSAITDYVGTPQVALVASPVDFAQNQRIIITGELTSSTQTAQVETVQITKI